MPLIKSDFGAIEPFVAPEATPSYAIIQVKSKSMDRALIARNRQSAMNDKRKKVRDASPPPPGTMAQTIDVLLQFAQETNRRQLIVARPSLRDMEDSGVLTDKATLAA